MAEPTSVSTKPSVPHAETSWSVLLFSVTVIKDTNKQTLNCLIEHLVEEELKVTHQNFISEEERCFHDSMTHPKIFMARDVSLCQLLII